MRDWARLHAHSLAGFTVMVLLAGGLGASIDVGPNIPTRSVLIATEPLRFDPADHDNDTYGDSVDLMDGDAHVRLEISELEAPGALPYLVVGTQDDHWRLGADRALEWLHVVDADPLGHEPGSPGWIQHALRTGVWMTSIPAEGAQKSIAPTGIVAAQPGVEWPQVFHINVRDDAPATIDIQLMDATPDPDALLASWSLTISPGHVEETTPLLAPGVRMVATISSHAGLDAATKDAIAKRWLPVYHFDSEERFFPTPGETLQRFHGFARRSVDDVDHRTWTRDFNNGRDGYSLLLADFNGDRVTDHRDVQIMSDVLRAANGDRVYAHIFQSHGDRIVVQYWTIYMYNYIEDSSGRSVDALAHRGDREFIQLVFDDLDGAMQGTPSAISYSQHYKGIRIPHPDLDAPPFDGRIHVYPATGSHASYPVPGDDRRLRGPLVGFGDEFDGMGEMWTAAPVEVFDRQEWAFGYLWGPFTRHHRDFGTATRPLLQHDFRYAWHDPMDWQRSLTVVQQDDLEALYG